MTAGRHFIITRGFNCTRKVFKYFKNRNLHERKLSGIRIQKTIDNAVIAGNASIDWEALYI